MAYDLDLSGVSAAQPMQGTALSDALSDPAEYAFLYIGAGVFALIVSVVVRVVGDKLTPWQNSRFPNIEAARQAIQQRRVATSAIVAMNEREHMPRPASVQLGSFFCARRAV